jgi:hypothetical protein
VARTEAQRTSLVRKVAWCQRELAEIKQQQFSAREAEQRPLKKAEEVRKQLPEIFFELAKEMLAEPVFDRIMIAAVHRQQERKQKPA